MSALVALALLASCLHAAQSAYYPHFEAESEDLINYINFKSGATWKVKCGDRPCYKAKSRNLECQILCCNYLYYECCITDYIVIRLEEISRAWPTLLLSWSACVVFFPIPMANACLTCTTSSRALSSPMNLIQGKSGPTAPPCKKLEIRDLAARAGCVCLS